MTKKFYVVWVGRETGVFTTWSSCKRSVDKFSGARYKSFPTLAEAKAAFGSGPPGMSSRPSGRKKSKGTVVAKSMAASHAMADFDVAIYCDGGCNPNPGKAGSGTVVYRAGKLTELWYGLYHPKGTNNTAELNALHQSLLIAERALTETKRVVIYGDSMYAINCISLWAYSWKNKGWTKGAGEIKNLEKIQKIHGLYDRIKDDVQLLHVKAHEGVEGNELADRMTMMAVDSKETDFIRYTGKVDVNALLSLRSG
ncbi:MAG: ribonuclease H family protein [Thermodesulfobacteriota bacterium]|nr:ribonuclease H family protein [Thermodesulfobacteriota bacterium]